MEHCEDYLELISAGIDDQLTEEEQEKLNDHLARYPECRALYEAMAENSAAVAALGGCEPPEGFAQSVMDRVRAESAPVKVVPLFRRPQFKKAMTAAACALLCIGVVRFSNGFFPMGSSPSEASGGMEVTGNAAPSSSLFTGSPGAEGDTASSKLTAGAYSSASASEADPGAANGTARQEFTAPADTAPLQPSSPSQSTDNGTLDRENAASGAQNGDGSITGFASAEYSFSNQTRTRLDWSNTLTTGTWLISSREELDQLLSGLGGDLDALSQQYQDQWFQDGGQLVAVVLTESSGSVSHQLTALRPGPEGVQVVVQRQVPQIGTCDMAAWLITAETDLPEDTPLSLLLES